MELSREKRKNIIEERRLKVEKRIEDYNYRFVVLFISIIMICVLYGLFMRGAYGDIEQKGQWGDTFGAVNALFSGLAFTGVIYAIFLQKQDLALQTIELELTRIEFARSAKAQEESEKSLREQIIEMKEQTELQHKPFVIVSQSASFEQTLEVKNVGNGTAINVLGRSKRLGPLEPPAGNPFSVIQKDMSFPLNTSFILDDEIQLEYENVNGKRYYTRIKLLKNSYQIIEYGTLPQL